MKAKEFDNGLTLLVEEIPHLHSVSLAVMVGVGSSLEEEKNNGISHVIEHMLFKGTDKRSSFEISEFVDRIGGQINAYTSKDTTCYYTKTSADHFEECCDLLSDMLFCSKFDVTEFEREKKVILEEITMGEDTPDDVCHDLVAEAFFGTNPFGKTIIGTAETVKSFTADDLRNFMRKFYNPKNIVITVAGNVTFENAIKIVDRYFAKNFQNRGETFAVEPTAPCGKYLCRHKDIEQAHLAFAFPSVGADDERLIPINVLSNIMGGGMSSRLFQKIREENGMAYSVFSYVSTYAKNGYFEIYAGTNPENIEIVCKLLRQEIAQLLKDGITDEEFLRGKEQLKGGLILSRENSLNVATTAGTYLLKTGKLYNAEEKIAAIEKTTKQQVEEVIPYVFGGTAAASFVGKKQFEKNILEII